MRISEYTIDEAKTIYAKANFTYEEEILFNLRLRDFPLEQCAEIMNTSISTVNRLSKRVKSKITRVI